MRAMVLLPAVTWWLLAAVGGELPLQPFRYTEGFEGETPPIELWASRGTPPVIAALAPSAERAFEGRRSLKIDITFGDGTYYYFGVPLRVPAAGKLTMSARLWVEEGNQNSVGFGPNFVFPPTSHSGCVPIESVSKPTGEWKLIQGDLVERGGHTAAIVMGQYVRGVEAKDVGVMVDRWAIFCTGEPGRRVVAYLDDIRIEGEVPAEGACLEQSRASFEGARTRFLAEVQTWEEQLAAARPSLAAASAQAAAAPRLVEAVTAAEKRCRELLAAFRKDGYAAPAEAAQVQSDLGLLRAWPRALADISEARAAGRSFVASPCNRPLAVVRKGGGETAWLAAEEKALAAAACAGEYESVSLVVHALAATPGVRVACSPLTGAAGTIPASAVDIRIVKSWFQGATNGIGYARDKWLIGELLLKDDALVRVDLEKQENYLRSTAPDGAAEYLLCSSPDSSALARARPVDAPVLQPVEIAAGESREFWFTIHVPDDARPGTYEGSVSVSGRGASLSVPLRLTVHPFPLELPRLTYSIYYRGTLSPDGQPTISSEGKSEQQYRAEIEDMKAHGVLYPSNYHGRDARLRRVLEIRRECGLPTDRFYNLGYCVGPQTEAQLPGLRQEVTWWLETLREFGYRTVFFYGIDEATGGRLARQKAAWKATQEAGGKTFVACYKGTFEAMGSLLNTAVLAGPPDPAEAARYHSVGSEAFCYANPQVGVEDPAVYRRNFGLVLWKAGFDGAMDYAYQHGFHHVWNDFDDTAYRDHNFTYPTLEGVVPTIAWEGFREGVDDVRYVTTLERAIRDAPADRRETAAAAQAWLDSLDLTAADLDAVRAEIAAWVGRLR